MIFSIGYYQNNKWKDDIRNVVSDYPVVSEVYFAAPGQPSGRKPLGSDMDLDESRKILQEDLLWLKERKINLTLLLNASCYGDNLMSSAYLHYLSALTEDYVTNFGVTAITTTSPAIANMLKRDFGGKLEIRASINMRLSSIDSLDYLKEQFDGFYIRRELYRSFDYLCSVRKWADNNGKKLYALVNSGCLAYCPWQSMHDNNIAHSVFADQLPDGTIVPNCSSYFANNKNQLAIVKGTFIRPEDVAYYSEIFDGFKIATRAHILPRVIIKAYIEGHFCGNLLDILEPGHSGFFKPLVLKNDLFPPDWLSITSNCNRKCHLCSYCETVAKQLFMIRMGKTNFRNYI